MPWSWAIEPRVPRKTSRTKPDSGPEKKEGGGFELGRVGKAGSVRRAEPDNGRQTQGNCGTGEGGRLGFARPRCRNGEVSRQRLALCPRDEQHRRQSACRLVRHG